MTSPPVILLIGLVALSVTGCKKTVTAPPPAVAVSSTSQAPVPAAVLQQLHENFARVHFDFDSATLNDVSKAALSENARIMQHNPTIQLEIQGHADERGTTDYNIALGDRRANTVAKHMTIMGVSPSRITALSYGEERPAVRGEDEVAWSQNRRAEFRILTGPDGVVGTTD